jgi:hypothetical protein
VHVLGLWRHNLVHLSFVPEVVTLVLLLSDEDVVLLDISLFGIAIIAFAHSWSWLALAVLVPLAFSWLPWRRPR